MRKGRFIILGASFGIGLSAKNPVGAGVVAGRVLSMVFVQKEVSVW
jgi:hypothetical protein